MRDTRGLAVMMPVTFDRVTVAKAIQVCVAIVLPLLPLAPRKRSKIVTYNFSRLYSIHVYRI